MKAVVLGMLLSIGLLSTPPAFCQSGFLQGVSSSMCNRGAAFWCGVSSIGGNAPAQVNQQGPIYTNGYTRSNGTYQQGYYRTAPDNNIYNNYSTQGNINPYTGQPGTVNPSSFYNVPVYHNPAPSSGTSPFGNSGQNFGY